VETEGPHLEPESPLPPDLQSCLAAVLPVLTTLSVPHGLIGAAALSAWGRPRATHDLDLLILVDEDAKDRLMIQLASVGITVNKPWQAANPMAHSRVTRFVSLRHPDYPLDLIYASDPHEREALTHTQTVRLYGLSLSVISPEDLMILKLKASRPTDFDDVISIVKNPRLQLDLTYLWNWADRLGLQSELHYVLQAAGAES